MTLVVMGLYAFKKDLFPKLGVVIAVLFAPAVLAYFYSDMWYHILIYLAAAFVGMSIGRKAHGKK